MIIIFISIERYSLLLLDEKKVVHLMFLFSGSPHNRDSALLQNMLAVVLIILKNDYDLETVKHKHLSNKALLNACIGCLKLYPEWEEVMPDSEKTKKDKI